MQRIGVILGLLGGLITFDGTVFGQGPCKTPPFITAGVSPNVLLIFDTSGSMWNVVWDKNFDPFIQHHDFDGDGNRGNLLPVEEDQVVFGAEDESCEPSPHIVLRDSTTGRLRLQFYKVKPGSTDICSSSSATVKSDPDGYFYFDRLEKRFIDAGEYNSVDPNHAKIFLPYPTYSETSHPMSQETWYDYNYLNWIFYRSTEVDRRSVIREAGFGSLIGEEDDSFKRSRFSLILATKETIKDVVREVSGIRFGVMRFRGSSGGELIAPIGSTVDEILSAVDEQWAEGWTPLAETMEDVWDYFSGQNSPIQHWCQKNFVILVTDGLPTKDSDDLSLRMKKNWDLDGGGTLDDSEENVYPSGGSDYMDDIALYMYEHDARPDLQHGEEKRNIITYTIGFSIANKLVVNTAFNGNGFHGHRAEEWLDPESPLYRKYFYIAGDQEELGEAISAAMREISEVASSGTGAMVASTGTSTDDLIFRASFHPVGWKGYLEAFEINDDQDSILGPLKWDAGELLNARDSADRSVWTALKGPTGINTKIRFTEANVTTQDVNNQQLFKLLDATSASDGRDIINFIRGVMCPEPGNATDTSSGTLSTQRRWWLDPPMGITMTPHISSFDANTGRGKGCSMWGQTMGCSMPFMLTILMAEKKPGASSHLTS